MIVTVQSVITNALRLTGAMILPGRTGSADQRAEALAFLNQMLDSWNAMRGSIFTILISRYTLSPSQVTYTIGPSGADFTAARPARIENANLVMTSVSPEVHLPLAILNDAQWANIRVTQIPTTIPTAVYFDGSNPNETIYLWGYPTQSNDLELFTWQKLNAALAAGDNISLPEGYIRAITYNLAVEMAPLYQDRLGKGFEVVVKIARDSRAAVSAANSAAPLLYSDAPPSQTTPPAPYFNWLNGGIS